MKASDDTLGTQLRTRLVPYTRLILNMLMYFIVFKSNPLPVSPTTAF